MSKSDQEVGWNNCWSPLLSFYVSANAQASLDTAGSSWYSGSSDTAKTKSEKLRNLRWWGFFLSLLLVWLRPFQSSISVAQLQLLHSAGRFLGAHRWAEDKNTQSLWALFLRFIYLCIRVICLNTYLHIRWGHRIPWDYSYRWLWAVMWMLGIELRISGSALNRCASLQPVR